MRKMFCSILLITVTLMLSGCRCAFGHDWVEATCTAPKTCSICGITEGSTLSPDGTHHWEEATCTKPKTCSICGEAEGESLGHDYNEKGVCQRCNAHKEYQNSYGYFSKSELYSMAKDAIENAVYPVYVSDFDSLDVYIEKVTDSKMGVGRDSFTVVSSAEFSSGGTVTTRRFAVIIEPHSSTKYAFKDYYVE